MKKNNRYIANVLFSLIGLVSFFIIINIENKARLKEFINTDYHMRSLPYIYICLLSMLMLLVSNIIYIFKKK